MHPFRLIPLVTLTLLAPACLLPGAVTPQAHYNLRGVAGIRDTAAPPVLTNHAGGAPDLFRQGSPRIMSSAPAARRAAYDSAIKFEEPDQCYRTDRNLVGGDNFVLEAWAYALRADDPGWHAVVANGDGGRGFLLAQQGGQWSVLVGGVGATALGPVTPEEWIHLAIVKSRGQTTAWLNGRQVADLPPLGGGVPNFSLGATAPNREAFHGWIAEVRYSTFAPGAFDPVQDFLLDTQQLRAAQAGELAARTRLVEALLNTPGVTRVTQFDAQPATGDWLLQPPTTPSFVQVLPGEGNQTAQILLGNGLVSRTFLVTDHNLACVSLRRADKGLEFVRALKPEARVSLNGQWQDIGGLTGAPDHAFITPEWHARLRARPGAFRLTGMSVGDCVKPYEWQPKCNAPTNIAWPPKGRRVTFHFVSPAEAPLRVDVSYEIYDGLPVMMKTFALHNGTGRELTVTRFEGEHLAVQPSLSRFLHVESDYSFAAANFTERSSGLGIHADGARAAYKQYYLGGGTTRFIRDPDWGSMATLNPAEDLFLADPQNALLLSRPPVGPDWPVPDGGRFDAFRTFIILNDCETLTERAFLAQRRFYRKLAPQTNEKQMEVHAPNTRDLRILGPLMDQMAELSFEMLQAPEHPGSLNHADLSGRNVSSMKAICDYASTKGLRVKSYELVVASQGRWGATNNCIDPTTGKPGSMFGQSVCAASAWADMYYDNMWEFIERAGMTGYAPDGPYHGDPCASTAHPHHRGLADSQWAQWRWQCRVLAEGQRRNLYLTVPDWYFLNGQVCTGMGYREATDNIDIVLQTVIYRQYIYDATFHKTAQMGWCNLNTEVLRGGLEANLDQYERMFFTLLSSGAQVWVRGHRLYDGPQSRAMLQKWMTWYRKYYDIIHGDIIHLRRPDGRDLDYYLHVNPAGKEKGLLLVFNPRDEPLSRTLAVPLYYTGLTGTARIRQEEQPAREFQLDRDLAVKLPVTLPANGYSWWIVE